MKWGLLSLLLISNVVMAGSYEDVPMNCLEKAEKRMEKYSRMSLVSVCRDRKNPVQEHYTFCDGSGCTGFTAESDKSCKFSGWWDGQDDQDAIDPTEWEKSCLTADDFKKPEVKPAALSAKKTKESSIVTDSTEFTFVGETKGLGYTQLAEAIGKQIRREYYAQNYRVAGHSYKEVTFREARLSLAKSEGDFTALKKSELIKLDRWFEDHSVKAVMQMDLETEYMSGTGLESNFIFIPTESYAPVLVVRKFFYAE